MQKNKTIPWILLVLALLAAAFCGYSYFRFRQFPAETYETQLADLHAKTEQLRSQQPALRRDLEDALAAVRADEAAAGEEAVACRQQIDTLTADREEKTASLAAMREEIEFSQDMQGACTRLRTEYGQSIRELEELILAGESDKKIFYRTLDDGPTIWTDQFLKVAEETGIYLTFFTSREANKLSKEEEEDRAKEREMLRAETMAGHSVQNHTYSHQYAEMGNLYGKGVETFREQIEKQDAWVYECTGFHTQIFRFPGGNAWAQSIVNIWRGDFQDWLDAVADTGHEWVQWNMNSYDAGETQPEVHQEVGNILYEANNLGRDSLAKVGEEYKFAIILSHDTYLCTLYAMKQVVPTLQEAGWIFLPLFPESVTMGENTQIIYT